MFDIVFKEGALVFGHATIHGDLAIQDGKIAALGNNLAGRREIPLPGKWLCPGALDVHTHFSLPFAGAISADDFFTGTRAAAHGGVTTIIDFIEQKPGEGLREGFTRRLQQGNGQATIDFGFHACIGEWNPRVWEDLPWAVEQGLTSLKVFTAYRRSGRMLDDVSLLEVFRACAEHRILPTVHAEHGDLIDFLTDANIAAGNAGMPALGASRPVLTETEAVSRVSHLAKLAGCPVYIVHLSAGTSADLVDCLQRMGHKLYAETCPQYLYLDDTRFQRDGGHYYGCCPPIRDKKEQEGLWRGLQQGHVATVATDHCPFKMADKDSWNSSIDKLPMGLPGVETMVPLLLAAVKAGRLTKEQLVRIVCEMPARLFGLYPRKGSLFPGADADLMVIDPAVTKTLRQENLHMATDFSPYEGVQINGWPVMVMSHGRVVVENDQWTGKAGAGEFLQRRQPDCFA